MKPYRLFAVVQPGLEKIAKMELEKEASGNFAEYPGGFEFIGHNSSIYRLNNTLRTISRILIRLSEFYADSFWMLEKNIMKLDWGQFINEQAPVIRVNTHSSKLYHRDAIKERVINAIKMSLKRDLTDTSENKKPILLVINIRENLVSVNIDTSGEHLHKRGYADWKSSAPIRETIASAMVLSSLNKTSIKRLVDPMCGSGTIIFETAAILMNLPLYPYRNFAFEDFPCFQETIYHSVKSQLSDAILPLRTDLYGYDISRKAIDTATHNICRMKLQNYIYLQKKDCMNIPSKEFSNSVVITNPPYGERLPARNTGRSIDHLYSIRKKGHISSLSFIIPSSHQKYKHMLSADFKTRNGGIPVNCFSY